MHTAICAFQDRAAAERAVDRLVQAGVARQDIHVEHRDPGASSAGAAAGHAVPGMERTWDSLEREVAVDPHVLSVISRFFGALFGQHGDRDFVDTYAHHVGRGSAVVVVDARDEAQANAVSNLMRDLQARDASLVQRPGQPPLRDVVAQRRE